MVPGNSLSSSTFSSLGTVRIASSASTRKTEISSICLVYFEYENYFERLCTVSTDCPAYGSAQISTKLSHKWQLELFTFAGDNPST